MPVVMLLGSSFQLAAFIWELITRLSHQLSAVNSAQNCGEGWVEFSIGKQGGTTKEEGRRENLQDGGGESCQNVNHIPLLNFHGKQSGVPSFINNDNINGDIELFSQ
ncbi:putative membrane protein [Trichinella spiralis]|uniref:hypothetical protein n=1 Tax=Trichinella spiralis TaxID=6334 RepID=UPI0001EFB405|nr:putative membrane protein [Trichinella spiralis]XP_003379840.1 putative membrane protein [Trichinella spiralis]